MPPKRKKSKKELEEEKKKIEEEEEEESSDEEEEEETDDEDKGRGKRKRKSSLASSFEPVDFTMQEQPALRIPTGRGKPLQSFPALASNVEKQPTEDVLTAHRFLFGNRGGKLTKKQMIANILKFSGYLEKKPKSYDKDKLEAEEELAETKYSKKAFKMLITDVKKLCHLFTIDIRSENGKPLNKEDCIENLLDFLSHPNADFLVPEGEDKEATKPTATKTPKKKATAKGKAAAATKTTTKDPVDLFGLVRAHKKGNKPSDKALREWVQAYVVCFDMDSATTKHAIRTASDKFGVDLTKSKERIKELLAEEM